jgi:hypothetical protein
VQQAQTQRFAKVTVRTSFVERFAETPSFLTMRAAAGTPDWIGPQYDLAGR